MKTAYAMALLCLATATPALSQTKGESHDNDEVIAFYSPAVGTDANNEKTSLSVDHQKSNRSGNHASNFAVLDLSNVEDKQRLETLKSTGQVTRIEPNYRRQSHFNPNDELISYQWAAFNTGAHTFVGESIANADAGLAQAWDITTGNKKIVLAIIDDGMDINHPDLQDNVWINSNEIPNNGIDDDNNGYVDDVNGWSFKDDSADVQYDSTRQNHGTAVAGVAGARGNNGIGIAGSSLEISLMVLKVDLSIANIIKAMQYAKDNGAHIVNMSFGGPQFSQGEFMMAKSLSDAGILMVTSAGNSHWDNDYGATYPSGYDIPGILSVAASSPADGLTQWSQHGQFSVDIAAPGQSIITTIGDGRLEEARYGFMSGTSFSSGCKHVGSIIRVLSARLDQQQAHMH